ncbi:hypothetical protein [Chryseobacterium indoltheticum]|uniref:hypothetical protein n=1 Tax=Chryseobacterium indoltheticum TaxID=254 RepID=UPI00404323FE
MATVLDVSVLDFLSGDGLSFNYDNTHGGNNGFIYQNQLPEKLIEQYEERIKELKEQVDYWKSRSQGSK